MYFEKVPVVKITREGNYFCAVKRGRKRYFVSLKALMAWVRAT